MARFETYKDGNGEFRWKLVGLNGRIVGSSSEGFEDESYTKENAKKVMDGLIEYFEKNKAQKLLLPKKKINLFDFSDIRR